MIDDTIKKSDVGVVSLRSINFNLVPVLRALQRQRSVSRAAAELGLTQSAVSAALGRLRVALGDPLLVRGGGAMRLTPRAIELIEPVEQLCRMLDGLLQPPAFDPGTLARAFTIATADCVALNVIAALTPYLKISAPHVDLRFVDGVVDRPGLLASGEVDLIILPRAALPRVAASSLRVAHLFTDDYVLVMSRDHKLAGIAHPTEAQTRPFRHLMFQIGLDPWGEALQHAIAGKTPEARISVRLPQLSLIPLLAIETGDIGITPRSVAERLARFLPLAIAATPGPPVRLDMCMVWGALHDTDPAHHWLRQRLAIAFAHDGGVARSDARVPASQVG